MTVGELKFELEMWEDNDGFEGEEEEQEWIRLGITLYEQLIKLDKENRGEYAEALSRLYLNLGRDAKMKFFHFTKAVRYLKQVTYIDPKNPKPCYHLSFLLEKENNYEGALFYAERAIKLSINEKLKDKLYCNMAYCYYKLKFVTEAIQHLAQVEVKAKYDPSLAVFLRPYQAKIKSSKKGYVPLSEQYSTLIETEDEIEDSILKGERIALIIHPFETVLHGEINTVQFSPVKAQILEMIILSEASLSIQQIAEALWGYDAENMSGSYVPRMITDIRKDIKKTTGIEGKALLKTVEGKYIWDHDVLKGTIHYKNVDNRRARRGTNEGITIL
ncbi:tetratricopeptide repeat protein [Bacillus sp. FJAT-45350]|uniref:tetratricopeptide repeat protein n=1 Tax=Bacillus sp. FJAT-45350 TaxID=2011014 RepID=UPI000BB80D67|nr:hypothetical protein [Bacillus sp. FJAT-45350]